MNHYYITTLATFHEHKDSFHPQHGSHYVEIGGGKILVSVTWPEHNDGFERFEAHADVSVLPSILTEGTQPIAKEHSDLLAPIGHVHGETIIHLANRAGALHQGIRISRR